MSTPIIVVAVVIGLVAAIYIIKQFFGPKSPNVTGTGGGKNPGTGGMQER